MASMQACKVASSCHHALQASWLCIKLFVSVMPCVQRGPSYGNPLVVRLRLHSCHDALWLFRHASNI